MKKVLASTLFILTIIVSLTQARADIIFDYAGNPYAKSQYSDGSPGGWIDASSLYSQYGTHITGTVTFTDGLAGYTGWIYSTDSRLLSYSFTSGAVTITSADDSVAGMWKSIKLENGVITAWYLEMGKGLDTVNWASGYDILTCHGSPYYTMDVAADFSAGQRNIVENQAGTWTLRTATVPVPAGLFLLAPALVGLVAIRKRFRREG